MTDGGGDGMSESGALKKGRGRGQSKGLRFCAIIKLATLLKHGMTCSRPRTFAHHQWSVCVNCDFMRLRVPSAALVNEALS